MLEGYIFGSGAQGRVTLDILKLQYPGAKWHFLDDDPSKWHQVINGAEIAGSLDILIDKKEYLLHVALGKPSAKANVTKRCESLNLRLVNAIHPSAVILPTVKMGEGIFVGAGAVINTDAVIEKGAIINTRAVIEHDTIVGEFANISPAACIGGRVNIEPLAFVGSNSVILARTSIGTNSVIGMGSVVTKSIPANKLAYGVPARIVNEINEKTDWNKIL